VHAARLYLGYAGRVNEGGVDFLEDLGRLALFVDLPREELETIAASAEEVSFGEGEWIIRQGDPQTHVYVIVEGEVAVVIDDEDRRVLSKGSFFGEVAVLLEEPATASIITRTPLTCLVIQGAAIQDFLVSHPLVTFRILKAEARRLKTASEWRT
jgi:CRP/FNR family transcriptional regulator, cyclic AMP receptor protein